MEYPYNREQHQQEKEAKQEAQERAYIASFPNFQALYAIMDKPLPARLLNEIGGLCVKLGVPLPPGWDAAATAPPVLDPEVKAKLIASCLANGVRMPAGWK